MKTCDEMKEIARDQVGESEDHDWNITPTKWADLGILSLLLNDSALKTSASLYETADKKAIEHQKKFKRWGKWGMWSLAAAASAGAGLGAATAFQPQLGTYWQLLAWGLSGVSFGGSVVAGISIYQLNANSLLKKWLEARTRAESERLAYFNLLADQVLTRYPADTQTQLTALRFFFRYQFCIQLDYFNGRGGQHEQERQRTVWLGAIAAGIIAIGSGGLGAVLTFSGRDVAIASLGGVGAALALVASRREEFSQDERNAERYERTWNALKALEAEYTRVEDALCAGNAVVFKKFIDAVHEQLSLEHRQWQAQIGKMDAAAKDLQNALNAAQIQAPAQAPGAPVLAAQAPVASAPATQASPAQPQEPDEGAL